jgi:hypothetical protein
MAYRIVFLPQVYDDLQEAVDWYNDKQSGLGKRFILAVKRNYSLLKKDPFCIAVKFDEIRCMPVSGFPYTIHYRIEKDDATVVVFAVYHTSRNPEIWKSRK